MPELPEVETIKRVIEPQIQGLVIENVTVRRPEVVAYPAANVFCKALTKQVISSMARRGKFLIIQLNSGDRIILHLRMTGCLLLTPADYPEEKHTHVIFRLGKVTEQEHSAEKKTFTKKVHSIEQACSVELRFSDMRRFGRFWLLQKDEIDACSGIEKLGAEPSAPELTAAYLSARFGKRKKSIKECLLDQNAIAGIGNIYSDEILFTAGIYPARPANSLHLEEWEQLAAVIPERISYFILTNKITPEEYLETKGQDYRNTPFLQVYGHSGKPCPKCGETLCRIVLGGRSSVYCPVCQKNLPSRPHFS